MDSRGNQAFLKEVRPVSGTRSELLAHITFNRKKEEARRRKLSERGPEPSPEREPSTEPAPKRRAIPREPSPEPLPPGPSHYTVAQLRRPDFISQQVMHGARATEAERAAQAAKKAEEAAKKLQAKQLKQIDKMMKKR